MKKRLFMFLFLLILCIPITTHALATNSSYDNIKVYFFYEDDCTDCNEAKKWLEDLLKEHNRVRPEIVKISDNKDLYDDVRNLLDINKDKMPLMVIGSNYFMGFNDKVKNNLTKAIKAYEESENYCNLVNKVQDGDDTKACLEVNEGIYEQHSFPVALVITISVIIVILIAVVVVLKVVTNKKKSKSR